MTYGCNHQPNKKRCSHDLKIYICGVHLGLLPRTSSGGLRLLSSFFISISSILVRLLPLNYFHLYLHLYLFYFDLCGVFICIFNFQGICAQVLDSSFLNCKVAMPAYSIPEGHMHKFCSVFNLRESP